MNAGDSRPFQKDSREVTFPVSAEAILTITILRTKGASGQFMRRLLVIKVAASGLRFRHRDFLGLLKFPFEPVNFRIGQIQFGLQFIALPICVVSLGICLI